VLRDEVISADSPGRALAAPASRRATVHVADVTLPLSLVLWAFGVTRTNASELGSFGLTADLSIFFYAGVALLIVSAVIELATESPSRWRMALHAVGLVVMLYGTAPLIYPAGRYSWLYKTIGVVQYVNVHGQLNHNIDIYQNWPGFFALAGWFSKVAGAGSPLMYAKWAQLVFELAALPLLYLAYDALSLTVRQRWLALLLYSGSNWIGQDYYSPQALGTVLSLGIMAIALRWLFTGNYDQFTRKRNRVVHREPEKPAEISRQEVLEAFYSVKSQQGPPGVDGITIADFEQDLAHNLQKIWAQMCSGAYFPPPVRSVQVTRDGRVRNLSVPTVSDRVAQTVIARRLEARLTQVTGARETGRAGQAARSGAGSWTVELNLRTVFANCRHDLLLRALAATTNQRWIVQYVRRYLRVPEQQPDGSLKARSRGVAADSPLGPVLADLFLRHVLDIWMDRNFPGVRFDRELTIVAVHCGSEQEAGAVSASIVRRFSEVGLKIRPQRVRIVHRQPGRPDQYVAPGPDLALTTVLNLPQSALAADPPGDKQVPEPVPARSASQAAFCITILFLFFVMSFTHELSPYIIIVQLGLLAGGRMLRPRWLPVALLAVAIGYLLPRLSFVSNHYGLLDSIGSFFSNVAPPSTSVSTGAFMPVPRDQILIQRCAEGLSVVMWLLALAGAWRRRRSGRTMLALVALTFSPALVLVAQAYGNEGVLRVYLFSLPWAAALAASAIEPVTDLGGRALSRLGAARRSRRLARSRSVLGWLRVPVVLGVVLGLFFVAFFGDDAFDVMPQTEVNTLLAFQQHAPLGPVYCATGNAPFLDTAKYNRLQLLTIFGSLDGTPVVNRATPNIADVLARNSTLYTNGRQPAYVVVAPSMIAYSKTYNEVPAQYFTILLASLAHSSKWKLMVNNGHGTIIYELPPGAA
jgi:retron-type reverse transcriptase